ncbi:MAG: hypothetical protein KDI88_15270 [Gammaproteobacteria bacterium]|nr:hypothetical protein [Gammaproteobacteria bacterium]
MRGKTLFLVGACLAQAVSGSVPTGSTFEVVHSGDPLADGNGQFSSFVTPSVNSKGTVVFNARLVGTDGGNSDNSGIYRMSVPGGVVPSVVTLWQVVREGGTYTIGSDGYQVADVFLAGHMIEDAPVSGPVAGTFNEVALMLPVTGGNSTGNSILAVEVGETLELVVEAGADLPVGEGSFREFNASSLQNVTANAGVTFFSALNGTEFGTADNTGIFRRQPNGSVVELVRKGDPAGGGDFTHVGGIRSNDYGDLVFSGLDDGGDTALYRVAASGQTAWRILGEGDAAPPDGAEPRRFRQFNEVRINNDNVVAFTALLGDDDGVPVVNGSGLYLFNGTSVVELVREGQSTPDGTATFFRFVSTLTGALPRPAFNDLEQSAFVIPLLLNNGPQSSGVFRVADGGILELAREGNHYEGGTLDNFKDPAINNDGLVVFQADLLVGTGVDEEGEYPIFEDILVLTDGHHYATVARQGQQIGGRTLREILFNNDPSGPANGLSDSGLVAYSALYTDGSRSVNVWRPAVWWRAVAGDGPWDQADNWAFNALPGVDSDVVLGGSADIELQGPGQDVTINSLWIGGGAGAVELVLGSGAILASDGITIAAGGTLTGGGHVGANVTNQGLLRVLSGTTLQVGGDLQNSGMVELGAGSELRIDGAFSGHGEVVGANGAVVLEGGLSADGVGGLLVVGGNLALAANADSTIEIGGTVRGSGFDAYDVGGTLQLDGVLNVELLGGFVPQPGDSFLLWQANTIEGSFDAVVLPSVPGVELSLLIESGEVRLQATERQLPAAAIILPGVLVPLLLD